MAGELAAEWIKIPDGNGNLQKVWVRDSTARRDIAQLQTDVSGKADAATTLAGYGITDAYTKTQVDGMIPSVPSAYTSNPEMDGTASPGSSTAWARGDHVHPHDSTKADASAIPSPSSTAPAMDGTAAAGSSTDYARADHVHPSDTAKQDALSTAELDTFKINDAAVTCAATATHPTLTTGTEMTSYGGVYYYKIGSRVHINIGVSGLSSNVAALLFTLPVGYRPNHTVGNIGTGSTIGNYGRVRVESNGEVSISANAAQACAYIDFDVFPTSP